VWKAEGGIRGYKKGVGGMAGVNNPGQNAESRIKEKYYEVVEEKCVECAQKA